MIKSYDIYFFYSFSHTGSELETLKLLFKEKERELSVALNKIDTLTKQLDDIHNNSNKKKNHATNNNNSLLLDSENFKQELLVNIY